MSRSGPISPSTSVARGGEVRLDAAREEAAGFKPLDRYDRRSDPRELQTCPDRAEGLREWLNEALAKAGRKSAKARPSKGLKSLTIAGRRYSLARPIPEAALQTLEPNLGYAEGSLSPIAHYRTAKGARVPVYTGSSVQARAAKAQKAAQEVKKVLRRMRGKIRSDLGLGARPSLGGELNENALVAAIIDHTSARVGNPVNKNLGVTTLRAEHVKLEAGRVYLVYQGKSGKTQRRWIRDPDLARLIAQRAEALGPQERLFPRVTPGSVRAYLAPFGITPKAIRTFWANKQFTHRARFYLQALEPEIENLSPADRALAYEVIADRVVREVAGFLGNTPKVAMESYIDRSLHTRFIAQA